MALPATTAKPPGYWVVHFCKMMEGGLTTSDEFSNVGQILIDTRLEGNPVKDKALADPQYQKDLIQRMFKAYQNATDLKELPDMLEDTAFASLTQVDNPFDGEYLNYIFTTTIPGTFKGLNKEHLIRNPKVLTYVQNFYVAVLTPESLKDNVEAGRGLSNEQKGVFAGKRAEILKAVISLIELKQIGKEHVESLIRVMRNYSESELAVKDARMGPIVENYRKLAENYPEANRPYLFRAIANNYETFILKKYF
jgi:hypothetical protein